MKKALFAAAVILAAGIFASVNLDTSHHEETEATEISAEGEEPAHSGPSESTAPRTPTSFAVATVDQAGATTFRVLDADSGQTLKDLPPVADVDTAAYPDISNDGAFVYFTTGRVASGPHNVVRQTVATGAIQLLVTNAQQPSVSPNGETLAYARGGSLVVHDLATQSEQTVNSTSLRSDLKSEVLAGVRSVVWLDANRLVALTSNDFRAFHLLGFEYRNGQLSSSTVRDSPRGQVIGRATDSDEVTVVDDMNGLLVSTVVMSGPAVVAQRSQSANERLTVWDVSPDGRALLTSNGSELRRQLVDGGAPTVLASVTGTAGF